MAKSTVLPFEQPSEFSPDPLTEVIQNGAKALLHTAIQGSSQGKRMKVVSQYVSSDVMLN